MQGQGLDLKQVVKNRRLFLVLVVSSVIHLALILPVIKGQERLRTWPDAVCFERLALNLLDGNGYSTSASYPYLPNSSMTPGYPAFLAAIYSVFGHSPYAVVVIQILLSLGISVGIIWWTSKRYSIGIGLVAGTMILLNLCFTFYSTQIMTDILFLCFLIPALGLSLNLFQGERKNILWGVSAGVFFGFAALTRPICLYFPVLLGFIFLPTRRQGNWSRRLTGYLLLLLVHTAMLAPWFARNKIQFGHLFFSTIQSFNLSHIHAAPIKASIDGTDIYQAEAEFEEQAYATFGEPDNEAERFIFTGRIAFRYLLSQPGRYAILYLGGVAKTFLPLGFAEFLVFYSPGLASIRNITPLLQQAVLSGNFGEAFSTICNERIKPVGWRFVIYLLGGLLVGFLIITSIIGFVKSRGFRNSFNVLAFISVIYFIGVTGPAGQPRHFLPVLPFVVILAAQAISWNSLPEKTRGER